MLAALAMCVLLAASPVQRDGDKNDKKDNQPDRKAVATAVAAIKEGMRSKEISERLAVLAEHGELPAKEVCVVVAKAVKDKDETVRQRAVDALRFNQHDEALSQLHKFAKRDKSVRKDEDLLTLVIKGIGHHADVDSIPVLTDDVFTHKTTPPIRARIYSLGKIRSTKSVQALINLMNTTQRQRVQNHMRDFRLALMVLTARDEGTSQDHWIRWWNKNKKTFKVAEKEPVLPDKENRKWKGYWGIEYEVVRDKRRKDRGGDPETGGN